MRQGVVLTNLDDHALHRPQIMGNSPTKKKPPTMVMFTMVEARNMHKTHQSCPFVVSFANAVKHLAEPSINQQVYKEDIYVLNQELHGAKMESQPIWVCLQTWKAARDCAFLREILALWLFNREAMAHLHDNDHLPRKNCVLPKQKC